MKFLKIFLIVIILLAVPVVVLAQEGVVKKTMADNIKGNIVAGAEYGAGYGSKPPDPRRIIENVIKVVLALVGTIFLVYTVVGGYWYITSHGEEDKAEQAMNTIRAAVIGLVIVLAAYSITIFVGSKVKEATTLEVQLTK
jgi:hypothetical protein